MHKLSPQSGKFYVCFFLGEYKINKNQLGSYFDS